MEIKAVRYKKVTVMLPYHNIVFEIGKTVQMSSQLNTDYSEYGKVTGVKDTSIEWEDHIDYSYTILFDSGKKILLENVPVQIDVEDVEENEK